MKFCPACESEYADKFRFCRHDGTALEERPLVMLDQAGRNRTGRSTVTEAFQLGDQTVTTQHVSEAAKDYALPEVKYCPACQSEYAARYRFCRFDGAALVSKRGTKATETEIYTDGFKEAKSDELTSRAADGEGSQSLKKSLLPAAQDQVSALKIVVSPRGPSDFTTTAGDERFELLAQGEIQKAFPAAFVRMGVQIRSWRRSAEADLFVLLPTGLFLIDCKNYPGRITGSIDYDQNNGEFWTCSTPSGETVQIKTAGKNPAEQALSRFWVLDDMAREAWGEEKRPYIYSVLLFPDSADLSGITSLSVNPEVPSIRDRVAATILSKITTYLSNGHSRVDQAGALRLIDFLGIPRSDLFGTWLVEPAVDIDDGAAIGQQTEQARTGSNAGVDDTARKYREEIAARAKPDVTDVSWRKEQQAGTASYVRSVSPKAVNRLARWPLIAVAAVGIAIIAFMLGQWTSGPRIELASQDTVPPQSMSLPPPVNEPAPPIQPKIQSPPSKDEFVAERPSTPVGKRIAVEPQKPSREAIVAKEASVRERRVLPPQAEPGTYETVRTTTVRQGPSESANILDELEPGTRLNVTGSEGVWLVVWSKTRQMTAYVRRDDARLVSSRGVGSDSYQAKSPDWKQVEADIAENLRKMGLAGVAVSVRDEVVYLDGNVRTDEERFRAQSAARKVPGVQSVRNRVMVVP